MWCTVRHPHFAPSESDPSFHPGSLRRSISCSGHQHWRCYLLVYLDDPWEQGNSSLCVSDAPCERLAGPLRQLSLEAARHAQRSQANFDWPVGALMYLPADICVIAYLCIRMSAANFRNLSESTMPLGLPDSRLLDTSLSAS